MDDEEEFVIDPSKMSPEELQQLLLEHPELAEQLANQEEFIDDGEDESDGEYYYDGEDEGEYLYDEQEMAEGMDEEGETPENERSEVQTRLTPLAKSAEIPGHRGQPRVPQVPTPGPAAQSPQNDPQRH